MLTEQQIRNWRRVLILSIGPYALFMPASEIQAIRDDLQTRIESEEKEYKKNEQTNKRIDSLTDRVMSKLDP